MRKRRAPPKKAVTLLRARDLHTGRSQDNSKAEPSSIERAVSTWSPRLRLPRTIRSPVVTARPPRDRVPAVRPPVPPPRDATPVGGQDPHLADFDDQLSRCLDWLSLNRARLQFGNTHHPGHPNQRWSLPLPTVLEPMGPASQPSSRESFPLGVVGRGLPARPPLRHPRRPRLWSHHPAHSAAAPSSSPAGLHAADTDLWHGLRRRAAQRTKAGGGRASARHAVG